jgi:hypothetical protein
MLTIQSCSVIEYIRALLGRQRFALVYIYCDYRDKDKQDTCSMIGELAKQLLLQSSFVPEEVWSLSEKHTAITTEKARRVLTLLLRSFDRVYICVDALDECQPQYREEFLHFLVTLRGTGLRFFCTGRSHIVAQVTELFEPIGIKTMEICAHEADIKLYIEEKISKDRRKGAMDEQLKEQITKKLVSHKL